MVQLQAKRVNGLGDRTMSRIEKLLAPEERIVFRAKYGVTRLFYDLVAVALFTVIGMAMGPAIILVWLGVLYWIYGERKVQQVVVTNRRLIHKRPWRSGDYEEIFLKNIESVKDNGQRLVVRGSGSTKIKLPPFLKDRAGLRRALTQFQED